MSRTAATMVGCIAILMWAALALFTASSGEVPPFQLAAMTFVIGGLLGASVWLFRPERMAKLRQPWPVWLVGIGGLFGYHFCYFTALRNAPAVEAGLIAYLWPLLIVVFSALLPGERLKAHHILGAILGLSGAALIVTKGQGFVLNPEFAFGYVTALVCALIWSGYSLASRRLATVPTDTVIAFCLITSVLALGCHMVLETTVWPANTTQWLAVFGLGLGPVGLAFFAWDHGVKHGDIQVLGAASYAAPLLSTLLLIATGQSQFTWIIAIACLAITIGAVVAAKDMLFSRSLNE